MTETYCEIMEYTKDLSKRINNMYNIQPKVYLRFNKENKFGGTTVVTYTGKNMYIEIDIPYKYTFGKTNKTFFACTLLHEYCHYMHGLGMSKKEKIKDIKNYKNDLEYQRLAEHQNWLNTKHLAKKLKMWNKTFFKVMKKFYYTATIKF